MQHERIDPLGKIRKCNRLARAVGAHHAVPAARHYQHRIRSLAAVVISIIIQIYVVPSWNKLYGFSYHFDFPPRV